jgi:hypothetical protein
MTYQQLIDRLAALVPRRWGIELGQIVNEAARKVLQETADSAKLARSVAVALEQELAEARTIIGVGLKLQMHSERPPGNDATWAEFDRRAQAFLGGDDDA